MHEYIEVTGTVVTSTDKAVLLEIGRHKNKVWLPFSTLDHQPTFTRGEEVALDVKEQFLDKAHPWLLSTNWNDYDATLEETK